jgi:hypothetical protein
MQYQKLVNLYRYGERYDIPDQEIIDELQDLIDSPDSILTEPNPIDTVNNLSYLLALESGRARPVLAQAASSALSTIGKLGNSDVTITADERLTTLKLHLAAVKKHIVEEYQFTGSHPDVSSALKASFAAAMDVTHGISDPKLSAMALEEALKHLGQIMSGANLTPSDFTEVAMQFQHRINYPSPEVMATGTTALKRQHGIFADILGLIEPERFSAASNGFYRHYHAAANSSDTRKKLKEAGSPSQLGRLLMDKNYRALNTGGGDFGYVVWAYPKLADLKNFEKLLEGRV